VLRSGWCSVDITPPVGTPLAGFAARAGVSVGIHDALRARVLVLEQEAGESVALVTADLLEVPTPMARAIRERIAATIGSGIDHVMVSTSHTHSGPALEGGMGSLGLASEHYQANLADQVAGAASAAWNRREPVRLCAGAGRIEGIGRNRRHDDGLPVDPTVGVLRVLPAAGPGCLFARYTCHAVVLGPDNLLISADYPGYAQRFVERSLGPGLDAMFANGAAGDVNTGHSADLSALGYHIPGRTFERAERLGTMLGAEVVRAAQELQVEADPAIGATSREVSLPTKELPSLREAEADLSRTTQALAALRRELGEAAWQADPPLPRLVKARVKELYARLLLKRVEEREQGGAATEGRREAAVEVQGIRLGGTVLIGVPFELFVEVGLSVQARSPRPRTWVVGYANGSLGYMPSRQAYAEGGYEVVSARFAAQAVAALEEAMVGVASALG
jgi:neutral ceramidase